METLSFYTENGEQANSVNSTCKGDALDIDGSAGSTEQLSQLNLRKDVTDICKENNSVSVKKEGILCSGSSGENERHKQKLKLSLQTHDGGYKSQGKRSYDLQVDIRTNPKTQSETNNGNQVNSLTSDLQHLVHSKEVTVSEFEPLNTIIDKIANGQRIPPQKTMQYEMLRFCTLRSYPKENKPFLTRLAEAGFYYANSGDELVCYCCARRKSNWKEADDPLEVHRQLNPNCRFLLQNEEVNVPIKPVVLRDGKATNTFSKNTSISKAVVSANAPCNEKINSCDESSRDKTSLEIASQRPATRAASLEVETNRSVGYKQISSPEKKSEQTSMTKFPQFASKAVRLSSFRDCRSILKAPENLAEAGFYYVGFGDCVRCFQCGLGLRDWSESDDPWIEHSRWSKNCSFVKQMRGQEFINLVEQAVQYSHMIGANGSQSDDATATPDTDEISSLLHTDAAQSLLEMGYHPNVIRAAIQQVLKTIGRNKMTAKKLMEIIFEMEEADEPVQRPLTLPAHTESKAIAQTASHSPKFTKGPDDSNRETETKHTGSTVKKESLCLEMRKLEDENRSLKQQSTCFKCKKRDVCIVFLPCGHLITCEECAPSVKHCPVKSCGKLIRGTVRTFMC